VELANEFLETVVVQIREARKMVAFKTPTGGKKPTVVNRAASLFLTRVLIDSMT